MLLPSSLSFRLQENFMTAMSSKANFPIVTVKTKCCCIKSRQRKHNENILIFPETCFEFLREQEMKWILFSIFSGNNTRHTGDVLSNNCEARLGGSLRFHGVNKSKVRITFHNFILIVLGEMSKHFLLSEKTLSTHDSIFHARPGFELR